MKTWREHPELDLLGAAFLVGAFIPGASTAASVLIPTVASVLAIFAAVVAVSFGMLYQSRATSVLEARVRFGKELRRSWRWAMTVAVLAAVAAAVSPILPDLASVVVALAATGCGLLATLRSVVWGAYALREEDRALPGVNRVAVRNETKV